MGVTTVVSPKEPTMAIGSAQKGMRTSGPADVYTVEHSPNTSGGEPRPKAALRWTTGTRETWEGSRWQKVDTPSRRSGQRPPCEDCLRS